jgi:hypothetical protein
MLDGVVELVLRKRADARFQRLHNAEARGGQRLTEQVRERADEAIIRILGNRL